MPKNLLFYVNMFLLARPEEVIVDDEQSFSKVSAITNLDADYDMKGEVSNSSFPKLFRW